MYLKSQYEFNHGNQVQSQPHGSEPLSPQHMWEKKSKEIQKREKKETLHPRKNPKIPRTPQEPQETPLPYQNLWIKTSQDIIV